MKLLRTLFGLHVVFVCGLAAAHALPPAAQTISEAELVHRTQQLYDALVPGNQATATAYYADDAMVYDEKGRTMNKQAAVDDVQPMPAGYSGSIRIIHTHAIFAPGVAVLAYDCDETETIFGQQLHARYHAVDTWLYRNDSWQIATSQIMRYYEDPATGVTDRNHLGDFIGVYELAQKNRRAVSRQGNELFLQRGKDEKKKLLPESGDLFFRPGVEGAHPVSQRRLR